MSTRLRRSRPSRSRSIPPDPGALPGPNTRRAHRRVGERRLAGLDRDPEERLAGGVVEVGAPPGALLLDQRLDVARVEVEHLLVAEHPADQQAVAAPHPLEHAAQRPAGQRLARRAELVEPVERDAVVHAQQRRVAARAGVRGEHLGAGVVAVLEEIEQHPLVVDLEPARRRRPGGGEAAARLGDVAAEQRDDAEPVPRGGAEPAVGGQRRGDPPRPPSAGPRGPGPGSSRGVR